MTPRSRDVVQAELVAAEQELRQLRAQRVKIDARVEQLEGGWGRDGIISSLSSELADAGHPIVAHTDRMLGSDRTTHYVILSVTAKQAKVREYGRPDNNVRLIRAADTSPATFEACRAAWIAAGRELPK